MTGLEASFAERTATATATSVQTSAPSETLVTARLLLKKTSELRDGTRFTSEDAAELHQDTLDHNLNVRTAQRARLGATSLLNELADQGFAWSRVAKLLGVSVPAVRKWRQGETPSAENRYKLAQLVAMRDLLESEFIIEDVAGWLELPFRPDVPLTPSDAYEAGRLDLVMDWAANRAEEVSLLDSLVPGWRERYDSAYEVFKASDGQMAVRLRR